MATSVAEDRERELATRQAELAAAIAGREHWQLWGAVAVYSPPGTPRQVRIRAVVGERPGDRFWASITIAHKAEQGRPAGTAVEAIGWAEGLDLGG